MQAMQQVSDAQGFASDRSSDWESATKTWGQHVELSRVLLGQRVDGHQGIKGGSSLGAATAAAARGASGAGRGHRARLVQWGDRVCRELQELLRGRPTLRPQCIALIGEEALRLSASTASSPPGPASSKDIRSMAHRVAAWNYPSLR